MYRIIYLTILKFKNLFKKPIKACYRTFYVWTERIKNENSKEGIWSIDIFDEESSWGCQDIEAKHKQSG